MQTANTSNMLCQEDGAAPKRRGKVSLQSAYAAVEDIMLLKHKAKSQMITFLGIKCYA